MSTAAKRMITEESMILPLREWPGPGDVWLTLPHIGLLLSSAIPMVSISRKREEKDYEYKRKVFRQREYSCLLCVVWVLDPLIYIGYGNKKIKTKLSNCFLFFC